MKYCDKCRSSYPTEFNVCPIDNSALRVTSELIPGMTIRDKYLILNKVGEGGMGTVYRARHLAFNEIRALKVVHQSFAEDRAFIKRFKTEAIVARKLQHPNAVRIDDLDSTEDGRPFIVMELVEGENLGAVIARTGILSASRALNIAAQVADALQAAHNLGIVHRDIKPDNILVTHFALDGTDLVKVVDFGIAKVCEGTLDVGSGYTNTRSGMIVGTPQYLSPEQAMGMHGDQIDGRADIYSLGIVLYVMLTGRLPFESDRPMGFLLQHVQAQPVAPHVVRPDLNIPPELSAVLMKALEKDRNNRFSSAQEMAQALRSIQRDAQETRRSTPHAVTAPAPAASEAHYGSPQQKGRASTHEPVVGRPVGQPTIELPGESPRRGFEEPIARRGHAGAWIAVASVVVLGAILASIYFRRPTTTSKADGTVPTENTRTNGVVPDPDIQRDIEQRLAVLKGSSIQVAAQNGVVTLSGHSPSKEDSIQAETLASQASGVKVVRSEIQVESTNSSPVASSAKNPEQNVSSTPGLPKKPTVSTAQPMKIDRAAVEGLISAGRQATENGEYDSAIANFQKALQAYPHNAKAQAGLDAARKAKQTEEQVLKQH